MLPTEELFVYVYALIRDLMRAGAVVVPARPGSAARTSGPGRATTWPARFGRDAAHAEWFFGF
jgi:hypothetical protein